MWILVAAAWLFVAALVLATTYRALFALAYLLGPRTTRSPDPGRRHHRFAAVVPAHDEELLIGDLIESLREVDYPAACLEIHVIADNCNDATAHRARELGATAHERHDPDHPGKGQALAWLFQRLDLTPFDAVALFDADNLVERDFFRAMDDELHGGARCLQGYYGISNPGESVLTRLMAVTYVMKNLLFNGGKATLGLSVVLMGTGMVFVREVIERLGWEAMTIGEDLEQSFNLLERGESIRFVADARIHAQESTTLRQGYTQRQRWASGRAVLRRRAKRALWTGIRRGSLHLADGGLDLLMPPYSKLLYLSVAASGLSLLLWPWAPQLLLVSGTVLVYQLFEIGVALRIMRAPAPFVVSLAFAPVFLVWKAGVDVLALVGHRRDAWTRTDRNPHHRDEVAQGSDVATR